MTFFRPAPRRRRNPAANLAQRPYPARSLTTFFEPLESREHLSANITSALADLTVQGTATPSVVDLDPAGTVVRFNTTLGNFFVQLYDDDAPISVANFLSYVTTNKYASNFFHRSAQNPDFSIIQSGSFTISTPDGYNFTIDDVVTTAPIALEFGLPNIDGTLAMARSSDPNSATSGIFFNNVDNTAVFNEENPYAVFGATVFGNNTIIDAIAAKPVFDFGSPYSSVPLRDYTQADYDDRDVVDHSKLLLLNTVTVSTGLTYTITANTNSALVTPVITNNQLQLNYTAGNAGTASITVRMADSSGTFVEDTFNVTVNGPITQADSATTKFNTAAVINILANDTAFGGTVNATTVATPTPPAHGNVSINPTTGVITYTPTNGYSGADSFTYTVRDSNGIISAPTTVTLRVNAPPVAANDTVSTFVNTPIAIAAIGNDTDADGTLVASTVAITGQPSNGSLSVNSTTGAITYTPDADFLGSDTFTYTVTDNDGDTSNTATVSVSVQSVAVTIGDAGVKQVVFTDADGTVVTIKASKASADVGFDGENIQFVTTSKGTTVTGDNVRVVGINITGATSASSLSIAAKGGDGFVDIANIATDGELKTISAKSTNLTGELDAAGAIASITFNNIVGAEISLGAAANPALALALKFNTATNSSLTSAVGIKSLAGNSWLVNDDDDAIAAPWLGSLSLKGDLNADIELSGTNAPGGITLKSLKLTGAVTGGEWEINGSTGTLAAASFAPGWEAEISGDVSGITAKGNFSGDIEARSIKSLSVSGNLTQADIDASLNADVNNPKLLSLGKITVKGAMSDTQIDASGHIGAVAAASIDSSSFEAVDISSISSKGNMSANIEACSLKSLTVAGNLTSTNITLSLLPDINNPKLSAIDKLTVKGAISALELRSAGNIGAISANAIVDSILFAGVDDGDDSLPDDDDAFETAASIGSVKTAGKDVANGFVNTQIAATSVGPVTIILPNLSNGGTPFGVAGKTIASIIYQDANVKLKLTPDQFGNIPDGDLVARLL